MTTEYQNYLASLELVAHALREMLPAGSRVAVSAPGSQAGQWIELETPAGYVLTAGAGFASNNWGATVLHRSLERASVEHPDVFTLESSLSGDAFYVDTAGDDETGPAPDADPATIARFLVDALTYRVCPECSSEIERELIACDVCE